MNCALDDGVKENIKCLLNMMMTTSVLVNMVVVEDGGRCSFWRVNDSLGAFVARLNDHQQVVHTTYPLRTYIPATRPSPHIVNPLVWIKT
jgi:hypothetical protein